MTNFHLHTTAVPTGLSVIEASAGTGKTWTISHLLPRLLVDGIIHDIAWRVWTGEPIDVTMGYVNQIWQGDANAYLARSFPLCTDPPTTLNMTGEGVLSVRAIADRIGAAVGREPVFVGHEADTALLGDTTALVERLGSPETPMDDVIDWMAHWVTIGGTSHGKPTKYESRTGDF